MIATEKIKDFSFGEAFLEVRIKCIEEESRVLLEDVIKHEVRFAKKDKRNGLSLDQIVTDVKKRYSRRFSQLIIDSIRKEFDLD